MSGGEYPNPTRGIIPYLYIIRHGVNEAPCSMIHDPCYLAYEVFPSMATV